MTDQVPDWFKEQWDTKVMHRFQAEGYLLKGMTSPPVRIEGTKFYFLRSNLVDVGGPYIKGSEVQPLNPDDDKIEISSQEWDAPFHIYDIDVTKLPVAEQDVRQKQQAMALGRKSDRITMDGIIAATLPAGNTIAAPIATFDPYTAQAGIATLFDNDVPDDGQTFCGLPSWCWSQMKSYKIFSSSDYVGPDLPFVKRSSARTWEGVHWFRLPKHLVNYTSAAKTTWKFRMWHTSAVGAGHNQELRTEWQRQAPRKRWFLNGTIDGACVAIQTPGIYEFQVTVGTSIPPEIVETHANS